MWWNWNVYVWYYLIVLIDSVTTLICNVIKYFCVFNGYKVYKIVRKLIINIIFPGGKHDMITKLR